MKWKNHHTKQCRRPPFVGSPPKPPPQHNIFPADAINKGWHWKTISFANSEKIVSSDRTLHYPICGKNHQTPSILTKYTLCMDYIHEACPRPTLRSHFLQQRLESRFSRSTSIGLQLRSQHVCGHPYSTLHIANLPHFRVPRLPNQM